MFYDIWFKFYDQFRCDLTPHMYIIKHSILGVSVKCVGVGAEKISINTHVQCGSVRSEKLLCAECAGVPKLAAHKYSVYLEKIRWKNWLPENASQNFPSFVLKESIG